MNFCYWSMWTKIKFVNQEKGIQDSGDKRHIQKDRLARVFGKDVSEQIQFSLKKGYGGVREIELTDYLLCLTILRRVS